MLTMWCYVQTAAWPQPEPQPEPQPDRDSLYINNDDVTQTAAVWTAAVCLGHNTVNHLETIFTTMIVGSIFILSQ